MLRGQNSVPATEPFHKNGDVTRGKLSLQHVPATSPRDMSPSMCWPLVPRKNISQAPFSGTKCEHSLSVPYKRLLPSSFVLLPKQ